MTAGGSSYGAHRPLAVVTTVTSWREPPRIRHQVTRQLTRRFNVLYVELSGPPAAEHEWETVSDSLLIFRPRDWPRIARRLRVHLDVFRRLHRAALARRIECAIAGLGYDEAVLVNFQFDAPELMQSRAFNVRIYVCNDDFQAGQRWWTRRMTRRAEAAVITAADACLAVSPPLLEMLRRSTDRAELFMPGHEFARATPAALRERVRPIRVCYMGYINQRLRTDWLAELAQQSDIELTLIGPVEGHAHSEHLLAARTVKHFGELTGAQLQTQLQAADVLVMPYDTRLTAVRAISAPNKLFQYLACGRPVVCSDLPSLVSLPAGFVYTAGDAVQFVAAVHAAFEADTDALAAARIEYAFQNTWDARGERLFKIIEQAWR